MPPSPLHLRIRPVGVEAHWCVHALHITGADGAELATAAAALSSSPAYDGDAPDATWGCEQVVTTRSRGTFFHAATKSVDTSWLQYCLPPGSPAPVEVRLEEYAGPELAPRTDCRAMRRVVVEARHSEADGEPNWVLLGTGEGQLRGQGTGDVFGEVVVRILHPISTWPSQGVAATW